MAHFIKLTVNDSLYESLVSYADAYSMPVATFCTYLVSNGLNNLNFSSLSKPALIDYIKSHSVDGSISVRDVLCYIGNHSKQEKLSKSIRKYKIKRRDEIYGKRSSKKN